MDQATHTNRFRDIGGGFLIVDSYSPYTAIVAKPWLHALGAVSFTLHQKVKYPSEGLVKEILGNQSVTRQCMVATIRYH